VTFLQARKISKSYETPVLDSVDIRIARGEALVLLGPSGCGKTTLLRIIAGLERADGGVVIVDNETLADERTHIPPEQRRIGMVFQESALFPHLTVGENVGFGLDRRQLRAGRVRETLNMVGLGGFEDRYPDTLSGGQAQRVALARALAPRPRLLLFDEPYSSLDRELRLQIRSEVAALVRRAGITSIFVTHDQEEAFVLGDQVAVMRDGRVMQQGTPAGIYRNPVSPWVASFVGEANLLSGTASGGGVVTSLGLLPSSAPLAGNVQVVVRPEHIQLREGDAGEIVDVSFYGHDSSYCVAMGGAEYTVRAVAAPNYGVGDRVDLVYEGPPVAVFGEQRPFRAAG
jgi:iron(III) transport system ATP-binding protein